jgi:hypothetical protein
MNDSGNVLTDRAQTRFILLRNYRSQHDILIRARAIGSLIQEELVAVIELSIR